MASTSRSILTSSNRLLASRGPCSCTPTTTYRAFSSSSNAQTLPPTLPLHQHPNSLEPKPLPPSSSPSNPDSSALSLLASQPSHYISALLLGRRYLLTPNDVLTIPKMKGVSPGDRIALTRILEVGSRDFTLRASPPPLDLASNPLPVPATARDLFTTSTIPRDWQRHPDSLPYLSQDVVKAELTVLEHTKGKEFEVEKFKRRKGYRRKLRSKLGFTRLRVGEIWLGNGQ